jgi:hypothetical protein
MKPDLLPVSCWIQKCDRVAGISAERLLETLGLTVPAPCLLLQSVESFRDKLHCGNVIDHSGNPQEQHGAISSNRMADNRSLHGELAQGLHQ